MDAGAGDDGGREPSANDDERLLDFLRDRDFPCPGCRYNLRNLTTPVCPECELRLTLAVGAQRFRLGSLITVVVSNALSALLAFISLVLLFGGEDMGLSPTSKLAGAGIFALILLITGGIAVAQIRRPQRFLALPHASGSALAVLSVFLNMFVVMFLMAALLSWG